MLDPVALSHTSFFDGAAWLDNELRAIEEERKEAIEEEKKFDDLWRKRKDDKDKGSSSRDPM